MTVYNDLKPLAAIRKKPVEDNPVRLQRMLCRIMGCDLEFNYVKGKDLLTADALSRSPTMNPNRSKIEQEIETTRLLTDPRVTSSLSEIAEETAQGDVLQSVIRYIFEGWKTNKRHIPIQILQFWSVKDELSFSDGIVYRGDRIVTPAALRKSLTAALHPAHMGISQPLDVLEHPYGGQE